MLPIMLYILWQAAGRWLQSMICTASSPPPLLKGRNRVAVNWPASTGLLTSSAGLVLQALTLLWVQLQHPSLLLFCLCMLHKVCVSLCGLCSLALGMPKGKHLFIFRSHILFTLWKSHNCEFVQIPYSKNLHWHGWWIPAMSRYKSQIFPQDKA